MFAVIAFRFMQHRDDKPILHFLLFVLMLKRVPLFEPKNTVIHSERERIAWKSKTMEDSSDSHSEETEISPKKNNKKRTLKTPAQVMALEKCYNEHKYPEEEMTSWLSQQIGLTQKQVSGRFCHRRSKDRRLGDDAYANRRQDHSTGQDRGSGMQQDSLGSTKQGDCRSIDPKEAESLFNHDCPIANDIYKCTCHYSGKAIAADTTSSESASSQYMFSSRRRYMYDRETSGYQKQKVAVTEKNLKEAKGYKPSGYLKVMSKLDNAAIIDVMRRMGRHYREDGPPLGVDFQPLPPGAFELHCMELIHGPFFDRDPVHVHSKDVVGFQRRPSLGTVVKSHRLFKQNPSSYSYSNSISGHNTSVDMYEDSAREMSLYSSSSNNRANSEYDLEGMRSDSAPNHLHLHYDKLKSEQTAPWFHDYNIVGPKVVQRDESLSIPSNMKLGGRNFLSTEGRGLPTRTMKEEKLYVERKTVKKYRNPFIRKMNPENEMKVGQQVEAKFPHKDNAAKTSNY
ncbi:uncharacterized protein LOC119990951 [Tripterygium wilfordii]|uniref:uncharacterized protein LOC119990951 n=1 Tax=Tripterygium wilfordii TaxID=458696 RepID=UPI0018F84018|nr:uncharacterized protein LOC119990951 [Tripterygium wilfordii]XP_038693025.1 uncharacterized protein LOC119990951 [Tripterygium wilfordii]